MSAPLVATKLYVPRVRDSVVARGRLNDRLDEGAIARLTVLSAPAGFGKTTALASWVAALDPSHRVAWLSLDDTDSDPVTFWTYVVAALRSLSDSIGGTLLAALEGGHAAIKSTLTTLVNDLDELAQLEDLTRLDSPSRPGDEAPEVWHLILDDYHLIDSTVVDSGLSFLVEHLPPRVHLLISTRADPGLPLARLRARGDLVEVRADDLRFTLAETTTYLNSRTGLDLSSQAVRALEGRTEGWIAALQLAALSMRGRPDADLFVAGFAGDDRYVMDYLVEEVLAHQPDEVRSFLLQTSILDRFTGALCAAVTGRPDGKAMIETLERANLFVVPLDDQRHWYRYHHLFADVLHTHLREQQAGDLATLHRRASDWYDEAGDPAAAIRHALAAGATDRAAALVELAIPALRRDRQEAVIRGWADALAPDVIGRRPVLALGLVGAFMASNEFDQAQTRLHDLEQWIPVVTGAAPRPADMTVIDEAELARLPSSVELYRAALALLRGDLRATIEGSARAVEIAAPGDLITPASAAALAGQAQWRAGELSEALDHYISCSAALERAGHVSDVLGCSITVADLQLVAGRLGAAARTYQRALDLAAAHPGPVRGVADMHVGLAQIALERGDQRPAAAHLHQALDLADPFGLPQFPYRWRSVTAVLRELEGDFDEARDLLRTAERVYVGDFSPDVRPLPAQRARVAVAAGDLAEAMGWAREDKFTELDDLSYLREFDHITLAHVLLAQHRQGRSGSALDAAHELLGRLLIAAEAGDRTASILEILTLLAIAQDARGQRDEALDTLRRAVSLGEVEGHVRVFSAAGEGMGPLLATLTAGRPPSSYVRRLLAAIDDADRASDDQPGDPVAPRVPALSSRERDVLRLLATDLDGPAIARHLVLSLNTVRTHTKNIYAKLGVGNRRAAVRRAHELKLLARDRT
jgi:LuxR family maltose regulon positive regulatory protein